MKAGRHPVGGRADFSRLRVMFVLFLALFLACYVSVLTHDFGITDDYPDFYHDQAGPGATVEKRIAVEGRPLFAWISHLFGMFVFDLEDLRWVRLVGIIGIALLAASLFRGLVRAGYNRHQAFGVCAILGSTLPFQLCAAWATMASWPFAAVAAGAAVFLADRGREASGRRRWALGGGLCLLAAFVVYQPLASFFWIFAAVRLLVPGGAVSDTLRRAGWYCAVFAGGALPSFAVYKLGPMLYPDSHYLSASRGGLIPIEEIPARLLWFAHSIKDSLNFLVLPETYWRHNVTVAVLLACFIAGGLALHLRGTWPHRLLKYGLALGLVFLTHGVMLVVQEHEGGTGC